ncbi:helix-turn-helix transcriptional regulator [Natranaerobius thermophilus]|uniref:YheO domain protein n=1 Tax=Natranaerobius thermophilus (strain ATCC BAA-1301 / DSM 18059 / JW/NM-WN-LF) TaxID=457570 RepID=B2A5M1_NATTJ|nr:PAS domain-containing protein [Natranaerobius thermophilus]ACB85375.1 YheO domain protein [Natranaerobius thermophilus JW/NM-WN-LF]
MEVNYNEISEKLKPFLPIVEGIATTFGKHCEVVLHDINQAHTSIVAIANGHVTSRGIGGPPTDYLSEILNQEKEKREHNNKLFNYKTRSKDGKDLKSTTILLTDECNDLIGALCINMDLTSPKMALTFLENLIQIDKEEEREKFPENVNDFLKVMIDKSIGSLDKPVNLLSKEEKLEVIRYLDRHRIFQIKGSIDLLAKELNVSRYTIYNYLDEVAAEKEL